MGAVALETNVYGRPDLNAARLGYLRLGARVSREERPVRGSGCSGGWYRVAPQGFICAGDTATTDREHPLLRAASVRPDATKPMPYRYAFVRAVAPLYLRIPTTAEQYSAEFKLKEHLEWWSRHTDEMSKVQRGANDVALDARGAPLPSSGPESASVSPGTSGAPPGRSSAVPSLGELLGGAGSSDPVPFWLSSGRSIPNVSTFKVPPYAYFANRVRRHTGLALVGSFATGPDSLERRFAVTVDLRLVPASKIKPDTGSPFHGVALGDGIELPVAFVQAECNADKDNPKPCAHAYRVTDSEASQEDRTFPWRRFLELSGKSRRIGGALYRETKQGVWLKASDLAVVGTPSEWPAAAGSGSKWIDVSIENQTLTLWEGKKPIYVTLVSTGQDGLQDPKTTKSTITGVFRIQSKHITATMDSNERSAEGGAAPVEQPAAAERPGADRGQGAEEAPRRRRGEGTFELRDVPYVQYFKSAYALHAAYWHDVFGKARSHGCINLSPVDAHFVFQWTDPPVPEGWHGVVSGPETGQGTTIAVHK